MNAWGKNCFETFHMGQKREYKHPCRALITSSFSLSTFFLAGTYKELSGSQKQDVKKLLYCTTGPFGHVLDTCLDFLWRKRIYTPITEHVDCRG